MWNISGPHPVESFGWAHPKEVAGKDFRPRLLGILLEATNENEGRIRKTIDHLAEATVADWMAIPRGNGVAAEFEGLAIAPVVIAAKILRGNSD